MDFALGSGQALLVDTARAFLARHGETDTPSEIWRAMAELGWPGLLIPEADGGSGGGVLDAVLLVEQFGYAGLAGPFISSAVTGTIILIDAKRSEVLGELASGHRRVALAFSEDSGEFTPESVHATVDQEQISGSKMFVKDADVADDLIVAARGSAGLDGYLIPKSEAAIEAVDTISGEDVFGVVFDATRASADRLLGRVGGGWEVMQRGIAAGALARAAEMVGLAQRILDLAVEYVKVREQSGQPVGAFQAVQHQCADMLRDVEGARYITYRAAGAIDQSGRAGAEVAMAKAYAGDACLRVARRGHQLMGAIGYCEEHDLHRLHKRIQAGALDFGDTRAHLDTIANDLGLAR